MMDFVEWVFGLTAEHLPNDEQIERRGVSWLRLLTPHFFQRESSYVVQGSCRLRGDRRDAIKADEILRIAEKVYGCPVAVWSNPDYDRNPQVWSAKENDWISLEQALERLFNASKPKGGEASDDFWQARFNEARPKLLAMIYGGE